MKFMKNKIITLALVLTMIFNSVDINLFALDDIKVEDEIEEYQYEDKIQDTSKKEIQEDKQYSKDKENNLEESKNQNEENNNNEGSNNIVDWPDKPQWLENKNKKPDLDDREIEEKIYGIPENEIKSDELVDMQNLSSNEEADSIKRIPENQIDKSINVFINGKKYTGGDLNLSMGDSFSYTFSWKPKEDVNLDWDEGNWFEIIVFKVPGLNLIEKIESKLIINGINVGNRIATYDKKSGELKYKVTFNKYIRLFDINSIEALIQGSGTFKFCTSEVDDKITVEQYKGKITITSEESEDSTTGRNDGNAWKPVIPPRFNNKAIPFGKGKIFDTSSNSAKDPQLEWRVTYLDELHKAGEKFVKYGTKPSVSDGNCIVEDTLDSNQSFYNVNDERYKKTPFYVELPLLTVGTNHLENGTIGNENYDGFGKIENYIEGNKFTFIDGKNAVSRDEINAVVNEVKSKPLSWTVVKDLKTKRETLIINLGKIGTNNSKEGITWEMSSNTNNKYKWAKEGLKKLVEEAEQNIANSTNGVNSAISNFDKKSLILRDLVIRASKESYNTEADRKKAEEKIAEWSKDYEGWRNDKRVNANSSLKDKNGEIIVPLPSFKTIEYIQDLKVNKSGKKLSECIEYKNLEESLKSLAEDQDLYLKNGSNYAKMWTNARDRYQKTVDFYEENRVYGFVVKYRSKSINTSVTTYNNDVKVKIDGKEYSAEDRAENVNFQNSIKGNFALGSIVLQKADKIFETGNDVGDIQHVENSNAGLENATFSVYCSPKKGNVELINENKAKFFDRDASQNGLSYVYSHTGESEKTFKGEQDELSVDKSGKLAIEGLGSSHDHYLVEESAPDGYYLNETPIKIKSETDKVKYKLIPNISRSVKIVKKDSRTGRPLQGAKFELYKKISMKEIGMEKNIDNGYVKVEGFKGENINGHKVYWKSDTESDELITDENGNLCIHRLDSGDYKIKEVEAPNGYRLSNTEYKFSLSKKLPSVLNGIDSEYHVLINGSDGISNNSGAANIKINKKDGVNKKVLENAKFGLFRFTGTEDEWKANPNDVDKWENVDISANNNEYFHTSDKISVHTNDTIPYSKYSSSILPGANNIKLVATGEDGLLEINKIPLGHYSIAEIIAPDKYNRDYHSFYFDITPEDVKKDNIVPENSGKYVQLYNSLAEERKSVEDNIIYNYKKKAQIAIVKYDVDKEIPNIEGKEIGEVNGKYKSGWFYDGAEIEKGKGLEGATYKLFMEKGGSGKINPNPEELKEPTQIVGNETSIKYDECLAIGTTNIDGILKLEDMVDKNNQKISEGLNMEEYYLMEVKAPDGYILDKSPIIFSIDDSVYPINSENQKGERIPGVIKRVSNKKFGYGIRINKYGTVNGEKANLEGAGFSIKKSGTDKILKAKFDNEKNIYQITDGDFDSKMYTSSDGVLKIAGLEKDTEYELTEVEAPNGYQKLENPITIKTAANKNEGIFDGDYLYVSKDVENNHLKGVMKLHKIDSETQKALAGAKFQLFYEREEKINPEDPDYDRAEPDKVRYIDVKVGESKVTDANGNIVFDNLDWNENYFIKEIDSPDGYILDESKIYFEINENSFDENGEPKPVLFPRVRNTKGTLGLAVLKKVDSKDNNIVLKGAEFTLNKKIVDDSGNGHWVEYGHSIYTTDKNGEIHFVLPPGEYALEEIKAPDGYLLEENPKLHYFEIKENEGDFIKDENPESVEIKVENEKGSTGIYLKKTVETEGIPIKNVKFNFYRGSESEENKLYFKKISDGVYEYVANKDEANVVNEAITNSKGEIKVILPEEFISDNPANKILYKEIDAPEGVILDGSTKEVGTLKLNRWAELNVENKIDENIKSCFVEVIKKDEKNNRPLKGVKFQLYSVQGEGTSHKEVAVGNPKETDENGKIVFENLKVGGRYHIVEVETLDGYVLDQMHHEIVVDKNKFDGELNFKVGTIEITNSKTIGSVKLKKVDADNTDKRLEGAEFELFKKDINSKWEHYGDYRYITDSNGEINLKLPKGDYYWIERAAPIGYMIGESEKIEFTIKDENLNIDLGQIENKIDPRDNATVEIEKVDMDDNSVLLEGAEFKLYYRGIDDEYHLLHTQNHKTDSNGKIKFENLSIGSYALKEVKSPNGYTMQEGDNMYYFNVDKNKEDVNCIIENKRKEEIDTEEPEKPVVPSPKPEEPDKEPEKPIIPNPEEETKPVIPNKPNLEKPDKPEQESPDKQDSDKLGIENNNNKPDNNNKPNNNHNNDNNLNNNLSSNGITTNKPNLNDDVNPSEKNNNKTPRTGDDENIVVWGCTFLIASIVLIALLRKSKK